MTCAWCHPLARGPSRMESQEITDVGPCCSGLRHRRLLWNMHGGITITQPKAVRLLCNHHQYSTRSRPIVVHPPPVLNQKPSNCCAFTTSTRATAVRLLRIHNWYSTTSRQIVAHSPLGLNHQPSGRSALTRAMLHTVERCLLLNAQMRFTV